MARGMAEKAEKETVAVIIKISLRRLMEGGALILIATKINHQRDM